MGANKFTMSKEIHNFDKWKHEKEHGPQFRIISLLGNEILAVQRIKDNKIFNLGPHLYAGGGIFIIKEFMPNMKHIRFVIDGNPATNSRGENYSVKTLGKLPINQLKISSNGRELSL